MSIQFKHEMCGECVEYICIHNYPCLDIDDDCPICLEPYNKQNVCYLDKCHHKIHIDCLKTNALQTEVKHSEEHLEAINEIRAEIAELEMERGTLGGYLEYIRSRLFNMESIRYTKKMLEDKKYKCVLCRCINDNILTYDDMFIACCNSVMPEIGDVSASHYCKLFEKYKCRLCPTQDMTKYVKEVKSLMAESIIFQRNLLEEKQMLFRTMTRT